MYLLRKRLGIMSITWYSLADTSKKSKNRARTGAAWKVMKQWMGEEKFNVLRSALLKAGFSGFTGEPDLFCWHPQTGKWFFAEAKGRDGLTESQRKWFQVCRSALGDSTDIRVYRLRPDKHKTPNQTADR
jgi:hypothetical protein